jgi:hypothetical protein
LNDTNFAKEIGQAITNSTQPTNITLTRIGANDGNVLTNLAIPYTNYFNNWGTNAGMFLLTNTIGQLYISNNVYTNVASGGGASAPIIVTNCWAATTNVNLLQTNIAGGTNFMAIEDRLTLTNNLCILLTNLLMPDGFSWTVRLTQDSTGGRSCYVSNCFTNGTVNLGPAVGGLTNLFQLPMVPVFTNAGFSTLLRFQMFGTNAELRGTQWGLAE